MSTKLCNGHPRNLDEWDWEIVEYDDCICRIELLESQVDDILRNMKMLGEQI